MATKECPNCYGTALTWGYVPDGPLRGAYLGCDECSETVISFADLDDLLAFVPSNALDILAKHR